MKYDFDSICIGFLVATVFICAVTMFVALMIDSFG